MKTTLIDLDRIPTLDELRAFFKENDWSAAVISEPSERSSDENEGIAYIKKLIDEHVEPVSRENGLPKPSACYGKNNPLIALRNNTEDLVASEVYRLIEDNEEAAGNILEQFDFTVPDIDKKADDFLHNAVQTLLDVMDYETASEIVKKHPAHEDFSSLPNNHAKQDFNRQYYKTRTKHPVVSYEELAERDEAALNADSNKAIENASDRQAATHEFWKTLTEEDKKLLLYRMQGKTYEEIAPLIGLKSHTAVIKRRRKLQ